MWMGETIGEICRVHVGNIFESVYLVNLAVGQKKNTSQLMNKKCLADFIIINCLRIATGLLMFNDVNVEKRRQYIYTVQLAVGTQKNIGTKL